jgi:hypothetical protein
MNTDSVKAKLKNFAEENGLTFQEVLTYYGLERTIYRISVSNYADHFVLKGGIFLYAPKPLEIVPEKEKSTCRCIINRSHL